MTLKIGVISPRLPQNAKSINLSSWSSLFWFNEIEAAFAYLLHDILDKLIIDRVLIDETHANTRKYQKLIEQIQPKLDMTFIDLEQSSVEVNARDNFNHYPLLEVVFKNGDLKTVFQPIVFAKNDQAVIHGVECLSRFVCNGQYFPPEFIFNYAAEKLKLTNYDRVCLMQALRLVPRDKNILIFVNVRPQTLIANDFYVWFKSLLKRYQLLPEQIVIEVTEQYCNIAEHAMIEQCSVLRNFGIRLAIDDFGAGISNLSMLEIMKPSYLKVSGRFIKNSDKDVHKQKIIKNVLSLADDFGINAILESVESQEEWQQALALGARYAQGFYFFRPMEREKLASLLT